MNSVDTMNNMKEGEGNKRKTRKILDKDGNTIIEESIAGSDDDEEYGNGNAKKIALIQNQELKKY